MLVESDCKRYIVVSISLALKSVGTRREKYRLSCLSVDDNMYALLNLEDVEIIDGRLPSGMCVSRQIKMTSSNEVEEVFFDLDCNAMYSDQDFWNNYEAKKRNALIICNNYINDIRKLHGLSIIELELPQEENKKTPEEERQEKLNAELEEYLRIGKEIVKEKDNF